MVRSVAQDDADLLVGLAKSHIRKAARRRLLNSNLMIADQAAINADFDLRR
jgi:hypothetical protein